MEKRNYYDFIISIRNYYRYYYYCTLKVYVPSHFLYQIMYLNFSSEIYPLGKLLSIFVYLWKSCFVYVSVSMRERERWKREVWEREMRERREKEKSIFYILCFLKILFCHHQFNHITTIIKIILRPTAFSSPGVNKIVPLIYKAQFTWLFYFSVKLTLDILLDYLENFSFNERDTKTLHIYKPNEKARQAKKAIFKKKYKK